MQVSAPLDDHRSGWIEEFRHALADQRIESSEMDEAALPPASLWQVHPKDWEAIAREACKLKYRWAGLWVDDLGDQGFHANVVLAKPGGFLVVRTALNPKAPRLRSQARYFPAADRVERHAADLYGVQFEGHPDPRRWVRHQAWAENQYPLRKSFPVVGTPESQTPPDSRYPFLGSTSPEVYEIPVGPVHAGIIEPGHFRFLAVGEAVLNLEERLGYVHKGIEKTAEGRDAAGLARLAGRVSGDSTVAHTWAACMAMERAYGLAVPDRALGIRGILAERERIANHLGDIGAICNDVGFPFAHYQFGRLREAWLRDNAAWFGHRLLMDRVVPGGVAIELREEFLEPMYARQAALAAEIEELRPLLESNHSLQDRLIGAGTLRFDTAESLGCLGYVGRASGFDCDLRRDWPYAPYHNLTVDAVSRSDGDVAARVHVRFDEIRASLKLLDQLLGELAAGPIRTCWPGDAPAAAAEGLGAVEGWRGEVLAYIRFGDRGLVARYYPRDPSVFNWPALEQLIHGNIVPDFPLCNKSVNASYAAQDL